MFCCDADYAQNDITTIVVLWFNMRHRMSINSTGKSNKIDQLGDDQEIRQEHFKNAMVPTMHHVVS